MESITFENNKWIMKQDGYSNSKLINIHVSTIFEITIHKFVFTCVRRANSGSLAREFVLRNYC